MFQAAEHGLALATMAASTATIRGTVDRGDTGQTALCRIHSADIIPRPSAMVSTPAGAGQ